MHVINSLVLSCKCVLSEALEQWLVMVTRLGSLISQTGR